MDASPSSSSARALLRFFLTLFLGAMILGPLLFFALQGIFPVPFHRAMDRALFLSALAALAVVWPRIDLRGWWRLDAGAGKQALLGFAMAVVSTQLIVGLDLAFGGLKWATITPGAEMGVLVLAVTAALLVPLGEETVFRGLVQTELVRGLGRRGGCLLGAVIFMLAHFVKIPVELDHAPVHAWSGVSAMGAAFLPILHGQFISERGINLLLIGSLLGGAFLRSGTLWLNYGLHGGWILALLLVSGLTRPAQVDSALLPGDLLAGPLTTAVLILLGLWLWFFYLRFSPEPDPGANAR